MAGARYEQRLAGLLPLHPDPPALRTSPFPLLVVDVAFEFLHCDFAALASHDDFMIVLAAPPITAASPYRFHAAHQA
jgi:hypothetical protein